MLRRFKGLFLISSILLVTCTGGGGLSFRSAAPGFSVTPATANVARGGSLILSGTNGTSPYQYRVTGNSGVGTVDLNTGVFVGQTAGSTQVTVTDWLGQTATAEIVVPSFGLDTTFGDSGYSFYSLAGSTPAYLAVAGDTATVVGVDSGDFKGFRVGLLQPPSWNSLFTFDLAPALDFSFGAIDDAGSIISVGNLVPNPEKWVVSRMLATGAIDSGFGITPSVGSGYSVLGSVSAHSYLLPSVAVQPGGGTLLAGYRFDGSNFFLEVLRLDTTGAIDLSFNATSHSLGALSVGTDTKPALAVGADGSFAVGVTGMPAAQRMRIYRFSESGGAPSFGSPSTVILFSDDAVPKDLLIEPDGKMVLFGDGCSAAKNFCGAKLNADGNLDTSFGGSGRWNYHLDIGGHGNYLFDADRLPDGRFVAVGQIQEGSGQESDDALIAILSSNGQSISHLRVDVPQSSGAANFPDSARSVFVLPDGRFLVAGTDGDRWFLARFWP